jgi:hypothetical protein
MSPAFALALIIVAADPASAAMTASPGFHAGSAIERFGARRTGQPRLKDCTRINGRFGYYGNPFCTEAEQRLWDRATAPSPRKPR